MDWHELSAQGIAFLLTLIGGSALLAVTHPKAFRARGFWLLYAPGLAMILIALAGQLIAPIGLSRDGYAWIGVLGMGIVAITLALELLASRD